MEDFWAALVSSDLENNSKYQGYRVISPFMILSKPIHKKNFLLKMCTSKVEANLMYLLADGTNYLICRMIWGWTSRHQQSSIARSTRPLTVPRQSCLKYFFSAIKSNFWRPTSEIVNFTERILFSSPLLMASICNMTLMVGMDQNAQESVWI